MDPLVQRGLAEPVQRLPDQLDLAALARLARPARQVQALLLQAQLAQPGQERGRPVQREPEGLLAQVALGLLDLRELMELMAPRAQLVFLDRPERLGLTGLPGLPASLALPALPAPRAPLDRPGLRGRLVLTDLPGLQEQPALALPLPGQLGLREPLA
jgi:hypothetical protein